MLTILTLIILLSLFFFLLLPFPFTLHVVPINSDKKWKTLCQIVPCKFPNSWPSKMHITVNLKNIPCMRSLILLPDWVWYFCKNLYYESVSQNCLNNLRYVSTLIYKKLLWTSCIPIQYKCWIPKIQVTNCY